MIKKWFSLIGLILVFSLSINAQDNSPILMQIGDEKVEAEEFWAIYQKNSRINSQSEKTSLNEYLDLYINFKLKVKEAKDAKMDTSAAFIKELSGYRKQLVKPYLVIEDVNKETVKQVYDRMHFNVRASHILLRLKENPTAKDTLLAYQKAEHIIKEIESGRLSFEDAAVRYSEDPSARDMDMGNGRPPREGNKGKLGFFSVFDMVYPFEEAAFNLEIGQISKPVRTQFGYHIIKLDEKIDAIGQAQAAHLFIKKSLPAEIDSAKLKIDELYAQIEQGKGFEELVLKYSDDKGTSENEGILPWFAANRMVPEFISAISKMKIGDISKPIQTSYGWHIIKFLDQKPIEDFDKVKRDIEDKLKRDVRSNKGKLAKIAQIKKEEHYTEVGDAYQEVLAIIDTNFFSKDFDIADMAAYQKTLITLRDRVYKQQHFISYLNSIKSANAPANIKAWIASSYTEYTNQLCLDFEDEHLEEKYFDFRLIMNEYRDGILLFELMDKKIWSKASADTLGLEKFFHANQKNYKWKKRAEVSVYHVLDSTYADAVQDLLFLGKTDDEILAEIISDSINPVRLEKKSIEKGKEDYANLKWKMGSIYPIYKENGSVKEIVVFRNLLKPSYKKLNETRGLVIADYQNFLEKEWIAQLKEKYQVVVDKKVLKTLKERDN